MPGGQRSYENIASILNQLPEVLATAVDNTGKMSISDYESSEEPDTASIQWRLPILQKKHDQNKNYGYTGSGNPYYTLQVLSWMNLISGKNGLIRKNSNPMGAQKPTVLLVITGANDADAGLFVKNQWLYRSKPSWILMIV